MTIPVDVCVPLLHLKDEVHELHECFVLLYLVAVIVTILLITTGNKVLIAVENCLSFETHLRYF